jgi:hypothetical protein
VYIQLGLQVDMNLQFAGPRIRLLAWGSAVRHLQAFPRGVRIEP